MWAQERCRISRPLSLAECRKKRPRKGSFVMLCFVLFALSGLSLVFVVSVYGFVFCPVFSSVCWCAVKNLLTHSLTQSMDDADAGCSGPLPKDVPVRTLLSAVHEVSTPPSSPRYDHYNDIASPGNKTKKHSTLSLFWPQHIYWLLAAVARET